MSVYYIIGKKSNIMQCIFGVFLPISAKSQIVYTILSEKIADNGKKGNKKRLR